MKMAIGIGLTILAVLALAASSFATVLEQVNTTNSQTLSNKTLVDPILKGPWADVRAYGAVCDGVADDTTKIQAAINANNFIFIPPMTCLISATLTAPATHFIMGSGSRASTLKYTGTSGYAITFGSTTASALSYGTGGMNFGILLTQNGGSGIRLAGTSGASLENLYLEGIPATNTSTGVWVDGGNAGNQFTTIKNVNANHFKFGYDFSSSGTVVATSAVLTSVDVFCDLIAGSIGFNVVALNANGHLISGGNAENCAQGVKLAGSGTAVVGLRFESNTADLRLEPTAQGNSIIGTINLITISDASLHDSNGFIANQIGTEPQTQSVNKLQQLTLLGNLTLSKVVAGNRTIILDDTTDGSFIIQGGPNSPTLGGAVVLRGSSFLGDPGGVIVGLGGTGTRKFHVNTSGFGAGTDLFTVNESGFVGHAGVLFSALGTPANGTMVFCSDCAIASPCAGAGTGAFAKRLNGSWVCN